MAVLGPGAKGDPDDPAAGSAKDVARAYDPEPEPDLPPPPADEDTVDEYDDEDLSDG